MCIHEPRIGEQRRVLVVLDGQSAFRTWTPQAEGALDMNALRRTDPAGHELMRGRVLRSMGTGRPSRVFPGGGSPLPSMGDRCRSGGSGHARAERGVTSPHRPAPFTRRAEEYARRTRGPRAVVLPTTRLPHALGVPAGQTECPKGGRLPPSCFPGSRARNARRTERRTRGAKAPSESVTPPRHPGRVPDSPSSIHRTLMATDWTLDDLAALTCMRRARGNQECRAARPDRELECCRAEWRSEAPHPERHIAPPARPVTR